MIKSQCIIVERVTSPDDIPRNIYIHKPCISDERITLKAACNEASNEAN